VYKVSPSGLIFFCRNAIIFIYSRHKKYLTLPPTHLIKLPRKRLLLRYETQQEILMTKLDHFLNPSHFAKWGFTSLILSLGGFACSQESSSHSSSKAPTRDPSLTENLVDLGTATQQMESCLKGRPQAPCARDILSKLSNSGHQTYSYYEARQNMYFKVDVESGKNGELVVRSIYNPNQLYSLPSDGQVPDDSTGVNAEHTWPQSQLKRAPRSAESVTDLYHLFPCDVKTNGIRGHLPFADLPAPGDHWSGNQQSFEPPDTQKGKTARAMLYMAVMYDLSIDASQERVLREWHKQFPVTNAERTRLEKIKEFQGNINPFILKPEWVDTIADY
jgi:endonuclease I